MGVSSEKLCVDIPMQVGRYVWKVVLYRMRVNSGEFDFCLEGVFIITLYPS